MEEKSGVGFGVIYGVYEFLHQTVGFEVYAEDEIALNKVETIELLKFDLFDEPDIEWRATNCGVFSNNTTFARRMKFEEWKEIWMYDYGDWHNFFRYLPPAVYNSEQVTETYHPNFYSLDGKQLCLMGRGIKEEKDLMLDIISDKIVTMIENNPGMENLTFTQQDTNVWCSCDACKQVKSQYGTDSASYIWFCNSLSDLVKAKLTEKGLDRRFNIYFFAYHKTTDAPVKKDSNGKYVAIDDSVICRDNVFVFYCPIAAFRRLSYLDSRNSSFYQTMEKWKVLSKQVAFWSYSAVFDDYLQPFDVFNAMQENYRWFVDNNVIYLMDQGQTTNANSTAFTKLKTYLNGKLGWNCNESYEELVNNFFTNYYRDAGPILLELFNEMRAHWSYQESVLGYYHNQQTKDTRYYSYNLLHAWLEKFDKAFDAIAHYETEDKVLYDKLYERINLESISIRYMLLTMYSYNYTDSQYNEMATSFRQDCINLNITNWSERVSIKDLWKELDKG